MYSRSFLLLLVSLQAKVLLHASAYDNRMYEDFGLPESDRVGEALIRGLPLVIVGFLLWWGIPKLINKKGWFPGCISLSGLAVLLVGLYFLLPLLVWIEYLFVNLINVVFILFLAVLAIMVVVHLFRK